MRHTLDSIGVRHPVYRIHIVGGPASGKTTLARRMAARLGAPCFDLDEVAYEGGAGPRRALEVRLEAVTAIARQPRWITEGIYLWWMDELLASADLIVWLDVPWSLVALRIVRRHIRATLAGTNRHPGLLNLVRFLRSARNYYAGPTRRPAGPDDDGAVTRLY